MGGEDGGVEKIVGWRWWWGGDGCRGEEDVGVGVGLEMVVGWRWVVKMVE